MKLLKILVLTIVALNAAGALAGDRFNCSNPENIQRCEAEKRDGWPEGSGGEEIEHESSDRSSDGWPEGRRPTLKN